MLVVPHWKKELNIGGLPYKRIGFLFTPAELNFLRVLDKSIDSKYRIFGKVRIADVIAVDDELNDNEKIIKFNKIAGKHFDFVICNSADLSIALVIELDDLSHSRSDRIRRDAFVNDVCNSARLQLLRIPARRHYEVESIKGLVRSKLGDLL